MFLRFCSRIIDLYKHHLVAESIGNSAREKRDFDGSANASKGEKTERSRSRGKQCSHSPLSQGKPLRAAQEGAER